MTVKLLIYSLTVMQKAVPRRMHSQALRHSLTVLTQSLRGSNKIADKSALTKNDLKREKLAIQSALTYVMDEVKAGHKRYKQLLTELITWL
jgi:hypothetical protein